MGVTFLWGETFSVRASLHFHIPYMFHSQVDLNGFSLRSFYVVTLVHHQVCNMSTYRQIQKIFNLLKHVLINPEDHCEKSKEHTLFMNLLWQVMSIMHCVNDKSNLVKYYSFSLLDTFQSKEHGSGWKKCQ